MKNTARIFLLVLLPVVATLVATLMIINLSLGDKQVDESLPHLYGVSDSQFPRTMGALLGPTLEKGNQIEALLNGEKIFPAMLRAIHSARTSVTLETYIFWSGTIGKEFVDALTDRARHGVEVHVLLDWIGGELNDRQLDEMKRNGISVRRYNTPHWYNLGRLNNRTHRKLMVVDGKIGFTGGVGIADIWCGDGMSPGSWRDTHFRIEGPSVAQMQAAFADNWMQATGEVLHGERYFPSLHVAGQQTAQIFTSSPGGGAESMQLMYLLSINAAAKSVRLSASYFVPDEVSISALVAALRRGVHVQIIVPGPHIDMPIVRHASRASWGPLLHAGAEIYEYQPSMYHVKMIIVDDQWVSVGSTNFDMRSFSINDEANLNVYDSEFALHQAIIFNHDLRRSRRVSAHEWEHRTWTEKLVDASAALLRSQL